MKNPETVPRNSPILMVAPLAVVVLAYCYLYYLPQQRQIAAQVSKLEELQSAESSAQAALATLITEHEEKASSAEQFQDDLDAAKLEASALRDRKQQMRTAAGQSAEPARAVELTTELLIRHHLTVLESDTANYHGAGGSSFSEVSKRLDAGSERTQSQRHICKIKIAGSFANLRNALTELASDGGPTPLALKMELTDAATELRVWIVTLLI